MATKLLTYYYDSFLAKKVVEDVLSGNNNLYLYTSQHADIVGNVASVNNDNRSTLIDVYRNMISGKKVTSSDIKPVIRYIAYEANKAFAKYDDKDLSILTKDFYCHVDEGALIHTYKCLDNNFGANSTVEPQYSYVSAASNFTFQTNDGYVWKYMYSVSSTVRDKFKTQNYFPVEVNANVSANAVEGAIDVINISQNDLSIPGGGKRYDNYLAGTFLTSQLRIGGNATLYAITNNNISYEDGFYSGCLLYLSSGTGVGQYKTILDYFSNANGNFIEISEPFTTLPLNGTTWEINPRIEIKGEGTETVNAVARALVNSTGSNSIYKIEMLEKGANYTYISANVIANSVITEDNNFIQAELRPIYGPRNGHGYDPVEELASNAYIVSVTLSNSEANTILTDNQYAQIGIINNPLFANVRIQLDNYVGTFQQNEPIFKLDPLRINANVCVVNTTSNVFGEVSVLSNVSVVSSGSGGSYVPDDILTIANGTPIVNAQVKVLRTNVRSAAINNAGSGYATDSSFTGELEVGTGSPNATFTVFTDANGECSSIEILTAGEYTANPPYLPNSAITGGSGSGLTVTLGMGLESVEIFEQGAYAIPPTNTANNIPTSNTGTGEGAELLITFTPILSSDFLNQVNVGDYVYLTSSNSQQLAIVNSITNATHMVITTNGFFTCTAADMYLPRIVVGANVANVQNTTSIIITNVNGAITTDDLIVGKNSGAKATVNTIYRNDVSKNFNTYIQLYKYDITEVSNNFVENEIVYQGDSVNTATATALVHSVVANGDSSILYTSNQVGQFDANVNIQGDSSLTVAQINGKYSPELVFGSGEALFIENMAQSIERTTQNAETFQIILTF